MLQPEEVKALLLDEDRDVRVTASDYFARSGTSDTEVLDRCLQAILKYDHSQVQGFLLVANLAKLPAGPSAPFLYLNILGAYDHDAVLREVNSSLGRLPLELWGRHAAEFERSPKVQKKTLERIGRRQGYALLDGPRLLDELEEFSIGNDDLAWSQIDQAKLEDLLEELTVKRYPNPDVLRDILEVECDPDQWFHTHMVNLVGLRRIEEFVPLLVDYLEMDEYEVLQEEAGQALSRIGDPRAIELLHARFPKATWEANIYASSVLGEIHDQRAEQAILDLLKKVRRRGDRVRLCRALSHQFSRSGIEILSKELGKLQAASDPYKADLEEALLTLSLALKVDIPERQRLLAKREAMDRRLVEVERSTGFRFPIDPNEIPKDLDPEDWEEEWEDVPASEVTEDMLFPAEPIQAVRRPRPNDKCPCGSGKKFKKCCGR